MAIAVHLVHGDAAWQSAAGDAIAAAAGASIGTPRWTRCGGSSLNDTWRLDLAATSYFVKVNAAARAAMLEAEGDGLKELGAAKAVRVPTPVTCGVGGGAAFLALEWLDFGHGGRDAALGRALAALHRSTAPRFGGSRGNTIGTTPQDNAWTDDWADVLPRPPDRAATGAGSAQ